MKVNDPFRVESPVLAQIPRPSAWADRTGPSGRKKPSRRCPEGRSDEQVVEGWSSLRTGVRRSGQPWWPSGQRITSLGHYILGAQLVNCLAVRGLSSLQVALHINDPLHKNSGGCINTPIWQVGFFDRLTPFRDG